MHGKVNAALTPVVPSGTAYLYRLVSVPHTDSCQWSGSNNPTHSFWNLRALFCGPLLVRLPRGASIFPLIVRKLFDLRSIVAHDKDFAVRLRGCVVRLRRRSIETC